MSKEGRIFNSFAEGIRPEQKLSITDWCRQNVKLSRSSRSVMADLEQTKWLIKPFEASIHDDTKEVVLMASTGSGKTTLMECLTLYTILERPNPLLLIAQTDADVNDWVTTGLMPAINASGKVKALLPKNRHAITKGLLSFPHMPIYITGANMAGLQSKSCSFIIGDECHLWRKGMISQAVKRLHDRPFSRSFFCSQPGRQFDDFDNAFNQTYKHEYMYLCPSCNERHPWRFENLKWEDVPLAEIAPVYHCPCGYTFNDDTLTRRAMSDSGDYVPIESENPVSNHLGFTYNALAVWFVEWRSLVVEFIQANEYKKQGNLLPLESFITKRLAQPWQEKVYLREDTEIAKSGYSLEDREQLDKTIMGIDKQGAEGGRYYYVVRTFSKNGESKLLAYGIALTYQDLEAKQREWNIPGNQVGIDTAFEPDSVLGACAANGWFGLNAWSAESYAWTDKRTGKAYRRVFSEPKFTKSNIGTAKHYLFSSSRIKDLVTALKKGNGTKWEIPHDVCETYIKHLNAEVKRQRPDGSFEWVNVRARSDYFDTECFILVMAMIHKVFPELVYQATE